MTRLKSPRLYWCFSRSFVKLISLLTFPSTELFSTTKKPGHVQLLQFLWNSTRFDCHSVFCCSLNGKYLIKKNSEPGVGRIVPMLQLNPEWKIYQSWTSRYCASNYSLLFSLFRLAFESFYTVKSGCIDRIPKLFFNIKSFAKWFWITCLSE